MQRIFGILGTDRIRAVCPHPRKHRSDNMAILMNKECKNQILFTRNVIDLLYYGVIDIYSGPQPTNPNDAPTGSNLARITTNGNAWVPDTQSAGGLILLPVPGNSVIIKPQTETWIMRVLQSGTAGWWRFTAGADSDAWIDGLITAPFQELFLGNPILTATEEREIDFFQIGFYW